MNFRCPLYSFFGSAVVASSPDEMSFCCNSAGEVSEAQKQQLEKYQATVKRQETELVEVRQQLAKLSEIVDRQTDDMKQLNAEARFISYHFHLDMLCFWCIFACLFCVVSTSASDCLERLVSEMTENPIHSLVLNSTTNI